MNIISLREQKDQELFCTYIKYNKSTGQIYSGRTSGSGNPLEIIKNRDKNHHMNKLGFGEAKLDKYSKNKDAIRGREQQLINLFGRAQSSGGGSGNRINGISPYNTKRQFYESESIKEFGNINFIRNANIKL